MNEMYWWSNAGPFQPWKRWPSRPDPAEVLLFFLKKQNIGPLEHMSRRAIVASALSTLAGDQEATIFRLFGLDPQAYRVPVPTRESVPMIYLPTQHLSDEILQRFHQEQATLFRDYETGHAYNSIGQALERVQQCHIYLAGVLTTTQHLSLLALQSRNHQLLLLMESDLQKRECVLFHADEAVKLAESATTLPELDDKAEHQTSHELLAAALQRSAIASYRVGQYELAQTSIDRALNVLPKLSSRQLKTAVLGAAALIHAYTAANSIDQQKVLAYIQSAEKLNIACQCQIGVPDDNFFRGGKGIVFVYKVGALSSPRMKGATSERVLDILENAQRLVDPQLIRQHISLEFLQAQAYLAEDSYQQATECALSALEKCRQIRSPTLLYRDYIEGLYQQILNTTFRDKPIISYLGVKLRMWEHDMD